MTKKWVDPPSCVRRIKYRQKVRWNLFHYVWGKNTKTIERVRGCLGVNFGDTFNQYLYRGDLLIPRVVHEEGDKYYMGFIEDVRTRLNETLTQRADKADQILKKAEGEKKQYVEEAADSKLDLFVLRRTPAGPGNPERLAKESALQTKIREAREKYNKIEKEMETASADLKTYKGIQADLQKGALQLIA